MRTWVWEWLGAGTYVAQPGVPAVASRAVAVDALAVAADAGFRVEAAGLDEAAAALARSPLCGTRLLDARALLQLAPAGEGSGGAAAATAAEGVR